MSDTQPVRNQNSNFIHKSSLSRKRNKLASILTQHITNLNASADGNISITLQN